MQGLARVGSGFAFSTVVQGHQVTAVGEVPARTVEFIAHSVKSAGVDAAPRPLSQPAVQRAAMRFVLYSRPGCGLCEELLAALAAVPAARRHPIDVVDVDADEATRIRYGHKIPVLLFDGELVCHGHLDARRSA